ncbi:MAG: LacI family transcriptional regulator [Naasia sp.]|nr:LacI family transcriptional regulator [Naasia sp.]
MTGMPTVLDVARVAGVSRQTVSNVINAPELVREETRQRVKTAIAALGYQPHASARRLRTRQSSTIGVRLDQARDGISGNLLDRFLHAMTLQADARGRRVLLFAASDAHDEVEHIRRLSDGADADTFVLTSTEHGDARVAWMLENHVPFVTFGRPWGAEDMTTHAWVDVDGRAGTAAATDHFLDQGLQRIGLLGWPQPSGTGDDRRRGWEEALAARGIALDPALTAESPDDVGTAESVVAEWWRSGADVEALVCVSDSLALGASMAMQRAGRSVPVVGFDNTPVARALGISSVEQRTDLVAASVLDLLLAPGAAGSRQRLITPELVVREPR